MPSSLERQGWMESDRQLQERLRQLLEPTEEGDPGLLRVPLFVSLAARVYDPQNPFQSKPELLKQYVEQQLSRDVRESDRRKELEGRSWVYNAPKLEPSQKQVHKTIDWIARQLKNSNQTELLIEKMQPQWLEERRTQKFYGLVLGLMLGLIFGLFLGIILALVFGSGFGLVLGIIFGLIYGLILELIYGTLSKINPIEGVKNFLSHSVRSQIQKRFKTWLYNVLMIGIMFSPILGIGIGLLIPFFGLRQDLELRLRPNQGTWKSLQSMMYITIGSFFLGTFSVFFPWSISVVIFYWFYTLLGIAEVVNVLTIITSIIFLISLCVGILGSLLLGFGAGGGLAFVQHFVLRFIL